jgi:ABC-type glycerol-3-phosphate transport system permease component
MIIPEFLTVHRLGLSGRPALILPYIAFGLSLPTLLLTLFFRALPKPLIDAAVVDGVSTWQLLIRIVLPLSRPVIGTVALLLFVTFWNEYPLAVNLIRDSAEATLPVAIANTHTRAGTPYPIVAAIMVMATIPVLVVFLFGQRQLVEGLTQGGTKE